MLGEGHFTGQTLCLWTKT